MHAPHSLRVAAGSGLTTHSHRLLCHVLHVPPAVWRAPVPIPENLIMTERPKEEPLPDSQKRVQPFLDCISYLLARRWLRDQRQQTATSPQERPEPGDEAPTPKP